MEFGPRALGGRSLLADPRRAEVRDALNRRIKHREPFRPFGASVLAEDAADWFADPRAIGRGRFVPGLHDPGLPGPSRAGARSFRPSSITTAPAVCRSSIAKQDSAVPRA